MKVVRKQHIVVMGMIVARQKQTVVSVKKKIGIKLQ